MRGLSAPSNSPESLSGKTKKEDRALQTPHPLTRDLVLVGGGHAHALVLRAWGMDPLPGARLTLINPGPTAPYTGMLPGHVAGHYSRAELEIDLVRLCRHAGARLILDRAVGLDRAAQRIELAGRGPVAYDVASFDIGITAEMDLPGFAEHAIGAKPLDLFAARWRAFREEVTAGDRVPLAVIGGGVAGVELALAMAHDLPGARAVICLRSTRGSGDDARSNIVPHYGHVTVPRHLRDIVVTEYGVADLRGCDIDKPRNLAKSVTVE